MTPSRLTPIRQAEPGQNRIWVYACSCGSTTVKIRCDVVRGKVKSCGCLLREQGKTPARFQFRGEVLSLGALRRKYKIGKSLIQRLSVAKKLTARRIELHLQHKDELEKARASGIRLHTIWTRRARGMSFEEACTRPVSRSHQQRKPKLGPAIMHGLPATPACTSRRARQG